MELSLLNKKMVLLFYYLGKMVEGGFISGGGYSLSGKGFDATCEIIEEEIKLTKEEMKEYLSLPDVDIPDSMIDGFVRIMWNIQERGYNEVMKEMEAINKSEKENNS